MCLILNTKWGIKEEIQELALLNANPVNKPNINKAARAPIEKGIVKKCMKWASVKIPAVINTLISALKNFLIYC